MMELSRNSFLMQVFTRTSHHENASIICTTQSYFDANKTIRDQLNYKIVFHDPTSDNVIRSISNQLTADFRALRSDASFLSHCFQALRQNFPDEKHPYLLIDSQYRSGNENGRIRSHIIPRNGIIEPIVFYKNPHYK